MTITITHLLDALGAPDYVTRTQAKTQLLSVGTSAVVPLIEIAQAQVGLKSCEAVTVLARLGDKRCIEPLLILLTAHNGMLALAAAEALEAFELTPYLERVLDLVPESPYLAQVRLVIILGKLRNRQAVPLLMRLLKSTDAQASSLRYTIIQALGELGDTRAVPAIRPFQNDADAHVKKHAQVALQKLSAANNKDNKESNREIEG